VLYIQIDLLSLVVFVHHDFCANSEDRMVYVSKNVLLCCWSCGHLIMNSAPIGYVPKKGICFSADIPSGHRKFHVGAGDALGPGRSQVVTSFTQLEALATLNILHSYGHLLVITGYKWDYTFYMISVETGQPVCCLQTPASRINKGAEEPEKRHG